MWDFVKPLTQEPTIHPCRKVPGGQFALEDPIVEQVAGSLLEAERPVIVAGRVGRRPETVEHLCALAEACAAPVYDQGWRFNLPNTHPLHFLDKAPVEDADMVLALDVTDLYGALTAPADERGVARRWLPSDDADVVEIRLDLLEGNGWLPKFEKYQPVDLSLRADTATVLPKLTEGARDLSDRSGDDGARSQRLEHWRAAHDHRRSGYRDAAQRDWDAVPITTARFAAELWEVLRGEEWVVTGSTLNDWIRKLWDIDEWSQWPGRPLGTATQIGMSMGTALAHRDAGRIVVDVQPDGDLLFDTATLWTIARHKLPMFVVMFNNRSYYNDCEHQAKVARFRGRDAGRAHIGMELNDPAPDFAQVARGFGWHAAGPVTQPGDLQPTLEGALGVLKREGAPVLVDVVTAAR